MIKQIRIPDIQKNFKAGCGSSHYFIPRRGLQPKILIPYRITSFAIGLYHEGKVLLRSNSLEYNIGRKDLIIFPPNIVRQWSFYDRSPENSVLFFAQEFIAESLGFSNVISHFHFLATNAITILNLNDQDYGVISKAMEELCLRAQRVSKNQGKIISLKIAALLYQIEEIFDMQDHTTFRPVTRPQVLVNQFINLLSEPYQYNRNLKFYADKLFITSKYLSQIVIKQTGCKATDFITDKIILEAKILLQSPEKTIAEISQALHFSNPTQFSKYFKRYSQMSPTDYRDQISSNIVHINSSKNV